jgi:hypothetical protein
VVILRQSCPFRSSNLVSLFPLSTFDPMLIGQGIAVLVFGIFGSEGFLLSLFPTLLACCMRFGWLRIAYALAL